MSPHEEIIRLNKKIDYLESVLEDWKDLFNEQKEVSQSYRLLLQDVWIVKNGRT
jgi:hypothetical protein